MSNWDYTQDVPTTPWRSAMTVPRSLTLDRTSQGLGLVQRPVDELQKLRAEPGVPRRILRGC
jgi:fructan beta-fructosidase